MSSHAYFDSQSLTCKSSERGSEGTATVEGLFALLLHARVPLVSAYQAQRPWGRLLPATFTVAISSDIPCIIPLLRHVEASTLGTDDRFHAVVGLNRLSGSTVYEPFVWQLYCVHCPSVVY